MKGKEIFKRSKGITLIALVITIIVLLILAGVTIATLTGDNGLLTKASGARDTSTEAEILEKLKLAYQDYYLGQHTNPGYTFQNAVDKMFGTGVAQVEEVDGVYKVTINGKTYTFNALTGTFDKVKTVAEYPIATPGVATTENSRYITDNKTAIIPAGYTVSANSNEQSIDNGLVIKKGNNEWVWIPVSSTDLAAMYTEDTTGWTMTGTSGDNPIVTNYKSNSRTDIVNLTRGDPGSSSANREPDTLNSSDSTETNYTAAGFTSFSNMAISLKNDYKNMIDSIKKYGGFYVGRYELGGSVQSPVVQDEQTVLANQTWYNLYAACKKFGDSNTESRMIWGCTWDQICKFISTSGDSVSLTDSTTYGNFNNSSGNAAVIVDGSNKYGSKQVTGYSDYWKANNIYDIAGNHDEYTQEASIRSVQYQGSYPARFVRGGDYSYSGSQTNYGRTVRSGYAWNYSSNITTSRPVVYIK